MAKEEVAKIDLKDRQLLFEMDFDARAPYSQLAKKVRLSKQGVEYKLQVLKKKGVVEGFYPLIHAQKLGYIYCRIMITLQNAGKDKREEIFQYLEKHPRVFWLFRMHGPYDIALMAWCKTLRDFERMILEVEDEFGGFIKMKTENIATDVIHLQNRFLLGKEETKELHLEETDERIELDDIDKEILEVLCKDARMPIVKIADEVEQSPKVVAYRIRKLEEKKLILGYRPIINHSRLGYTYYKLFISLNNISKPALAKLKAYIKAQPVVIYWVEGISLAADLDIELMVKDNQELFDFIENIRIKFPTMVSEYQTVVFMEMLKVKYLPF